MENVKITYGYPDSHNQMPVMYEDHIVGQLEIIANYKNSHMGTPMDKFIFADPANNVYFTNIGYRVEEMHEYLTRYYTLMLNCYDFVPGWQSKLSGLIRDNNIRCQQFKLLPMFKRDPDIELGDFSSIYFFVDRESASIANRLRGWVSHD